MTNNEAEDLLYYTAASRAVGLGFRLGQGADQDFRASARHAVGLIFVPGRPDDAIDADLERAVRSFQVLVDTMIGVRRQAYAYDPQLLASNIVGEDTLARARAMLCPGFWPFC